MFVAPSCQAGIGAILFPVGAFEILFGAYKTFVGVTGVCNLKGEKDMPTLQKTMFAIELFVPALSHLGLGAAATALGVKFNKSNN